MKNRSLHILFLLPLIFAAAQSHAQTYCTPTMTTGGMYIMDILYGNTTVSTGITGGTDQTNGSTGYSNLSGSAIGTVHRDCSVGLYYHLYNPTGSTQSYNLSVYADWNGDGDFSDAGETLLNTNNTLNGLTSLGTGMSFTVASIAGSSVRLRWAVRQGGSQASACGGYTGEIEDYTLTVPANTAPVLNNAGTPFFNPLLQTQTTNNGQSVEAMVTSTLPGTTMVTDADACSTTKAIAIVSTTATNGQWQYNLAGSGTWTNFGAVSASNALLLYSDNSHDTRIRFVPTGAGTASFDFRAWDRSVGSSGSYYNITATGGITAFSTATETASLTTYSTASTTSDAKAYMPLVNAPNSVFNLLVSSLTASTAILKQNDLLTTDGTAGFGTDIDIDATNNKLVWVGGSTTADLMRCNMDGSNIETLSSGQITYGSGLAIGGGHIFISDSWGAALWRCNLDGSGMGLISGGAGQAADIGTLADMEYYSNKIYYVNQPNYVGNYIIRQANTDGTGNVDFYTTANALTGLAISAGIVYWTETDASNISYVKSKPVAGGSVTTLASESGRIYNDVFVDGTNARIYIADADISTYSQGSIKYIPLTGGSPSRVLTVDGMAPTILFSVSATLPVQFMGISARQQGSANLVEWQVGMEDNTDRYSIERSPDGNSFAEAGIVNATRQFNYSWTNTHPFDNTTFYRVKAIDRDGKARFSNIVKVSSSQTAAAGINVYPNAVTGKQFMLQMNNLPAGNYSLQLYNTAGQPVFSKTLQHGGGNATQAVVLPQALPAGMYRLRLSGKEQYGLSIVVE